MLDYTFAITGQDLSGPAWKAFVDNVKKANDQVAALGKTKGMDDLASSLTAIKGRIDGLVSGAKGLIGTISGLWAVQQVQAYADKVSEAAVRIADMARDLKVTTDQAQALYEISRKTGQSVNDLAEYGKKNPEWLAKVTEEARRFGQVMDREAVRSLKDLADKSEEADRKLTKLLGPGVAAGKSWIADGIERITTDLGTVALHEGILDKLMALGRMLGYGGGGGAAQQFRADELDSLVANKERDLEQTRRRLETGREQSRARGYDVPLDPNGEIAAAQKALDDARVLRSQAIEKAKREAYSPPPEYTVPGGVITGTGGTTGGGGGGSGRDRIGENLIQFTAQADAARTALEALQKVGQNPLIPLDDLERQVKLEKDIADAKAAAIKYAKDDPRIPQLEQQIRRREEAETGLRKLTDAYKTADATERQYGDGQAMRAQTENQLRDARDTGRLSVQAYDLALQELGKSTEELRLRNIGLAGGLPALGAGWEHARLQAERANNLFATGGRLYEQVVGTMNLAATSWGQTWDQVLLRAGESWARFLLDMAARAAASQVFSAISGSGLFSWLTGGASAGSQAFSDSAGGLAQSLVGGGLLSAGGGAVRAGQPSIVGEYAPELWVPNTGGNVLNRQQLDALGVGGGGGDRIVINMGGLTFGEFVSPSQMRAAIRETYRAAVEDAERRFVDKRRRGVPGVKGAFA